MLRWPADKWFVKPSRTFLSKSSNQHLIETSSELHFSLREEARNTERHYLTNLDYKLRDFHVNFVSAGTSKADESVQLPCEKSAESKEQLQTPSAEKEMGCTNCQEYPVAEHAAAPAIPLSRMNLSDNRSGSAEVGKDELKSDEEMSQEGNQDKGIRQGFFFTDLQGSNEKVLTNCSAPPELSRSLSPAPSDSSEEVILFVGRSNSPWRVLNRQNVVTRICQKQDDHLHQLSKSAEVSHKPLVSVIDDPIYTNTSNSSSKMPSSYIERSTTSTITEFQKPSGLCNDATSLKRRRGKFQKRPREVVDDDEIVEDYILNSRGDERLEKFVEKFTLDGHDVDSSDVEHAQDHRDRSISNPATESCEKDAQDWNNPKLADFDELSTSCEALDGIKQVLSKRERPSGVQYLIVGEGYTIDDARWLPVFSLRASGVEEQIRLFDEECTRANRFFKKGGHLDSSPSEGEGVKRRFYDDLDNSANDCDPEDRPKDNMTDEHIARLLSKQEELGLGSEDLVLFDGAVFGEGRMKEAQLDSLRKRPLPAQRQLKSKRTDRDHYGFPCANGVTDLPDEGPYNGFDIMNQERPSLRKSLKSRRAEPDLRCSDLELEQSIEIAWQRDRMKKRLRKQEREDLRARGLVGGKGKVDMRAKYGEGMSIDDVKGEIRIFLLSPMERYVNILSERRSRQAHMSSLPLPPMAQKERKIVHEIANVLKLKSKSVGSGKSRFPVLYKTARTIQYDEEALSIVEAMWSSKRFLPRMDNAPKLRRRVGKTQGGLASTGVSYRDGEVVGAAAPELGQENRGRAMLEKMGWCTGTVLGAVNNNRGIVQPVTQIVKTGKAGLG